MIEDFVNFYLIYHPHASQEQITSVIKKHLEYDTLVMVEDQKGMAGFLRFNIIGDCAHILDLIVRDDVDGVETIKLLAARAWSKFPFIKYYRFEREEKYPDKPKVSHRVAQLFKGK